ncbi:rhodanese-like domain-containing protein [Brevibacterium sp. 5221]|uniref:Rhodanese-like domain-containing protein n=1 Tax=Brevibacterium rongguiense TaxID=2695267 RepID=A0A6N9HA05_9MICO|nr:MULTISPECIES: rhodanese-like domain-containing protein [Brevibacterium]MYM20601.1 rhodanese-like domain-containing protein [Brevibacterium rongguiense]WAL39349.1 rhodanese-like domain-containing protein [Brevibacterium sp. BRM-1]
MSIPSVSVTEIPQGANILDVREDDEFAAGHIDGAQHIRLGDLPVRYGEVPLDEDVYVICRSGGRSRQATMWLNDNGFDAINVDGGMGAWNLDHGLPIVSGGDGEAWVK